MFAKKVEVTVIEPAGPKPCPLEWLDSYAMRNFTGRSAFDRTLPVKDGWLEAGLEIELAALQADMEDWMTRKFGKGSAVKLKLAQRS